AKWAGARDRSYVDAAIALEHRVAIAAVQITLLSVWRATIQIMSDPDWHHFGSKDDRRRWHTETAALRNEVKGYYWNPDVNLFVTSHPGYVPENIARWMRSLDELADDIKDTVRRENNLRIVISIGVLIVTAGVGAALGALEVGVLTIVL